MIGVAHAILIVKGQYVLQLRDDKPDISVPGMWSLFGGRIERGETPRNALIREIQEELTIHLQQLRLFWEFKRFDSFSNSDVHFFIFASDITDLWGEHRLEEGQAAALFNYSELKGLGNLPPLIMEILHRHHNLEKSTRT